ncbi:MAG: response regulator, partial [Bdellovibrionales bacterium]|nr:response regulator [Bdellovibrionales bacterium]
MSKLISSILLVEDDAGHAALISRVLKDFADNVNVSPTIENAKECLSNELFTLVVTDLNLPGSKGVTHVQEFQQIAPNTPVIVLSSSQSLKDVVLAMQMGAKDYVVKEFNDDFKELVGLSLSRVYAAILLEQEHRKLQSQMRALRIAIESSADGLAVLGEQGQIQYCNRAFTEIVETLGGTPTNILECFSQAVKRR